MSQLKISQLDELASVSSDDALAIVDTSSSETKKVSAANLGKIGGSLSPAVFDRFTDIIQKRDTEWLGSFEQVETGKTLSGAGGFTVSAGTGFFVFVINAGSDVSGSINVNGVRVDKDTGVGGLPTNEAIPVTALSVDNSDTDLEGNTRLAFSQAYVTDSWYRGGVVVSTTDLDISDVDVYQLQYEWFDYNPVIRLDSYDISGYATAVGAWAFSYLYAVEMDLTLKTLAISRKASLDINPTTAIGYARSRIVMSGIELDGATDGVFTQTFLGRITGLEWQDLHIKLWTSTQSDSNS